MAFGNSNKPRPDPHTGNVREDRVSSNEQGRPVNYVAGTQRVELIWLCDLFDVVVTDSPRPGKK
jgi:hypothetical protein